MQDFDHEQQEIEDFDSTSELNGSTSMYDSEQEEQDFEVVSLSNKFMMMEMKSFSFLLGGRLRVHNKPEGWQKILCFRLWISQKSR